MADDWDRLLAAANAVRNGREISPFVSAGQVAAALETARGNIYVGVCVDAACGWGTCAERVAIFAMLAQGEHEIRRIVAVGADGNAAPPCGACREAMMQLSPDAGEIEVLLRVQPRRACTLRQLLPDWWGRERFEQ